MNKRDNSYEMQRVQLTRERLEAVLKLELARAFGPYDLALSSVQIDEVRMHAEVRATDASGGVATEFVLGPDFLRYAAEVVSHERRGPLDGYSARPEGPNFEMVAATIAKGDIEGRTTEANIVKRCPECGTWPWEACVGW
jgi:hypothetical protein